MKFEHKMLMLVLVVMKWTLIGCCSVWHIETASTCEIVCRNTQILTHIIHYPCLCIFCCLVFLLLVFSYSISCCKIAEFSLLQEFLTVLDWENHSTWVISWCREFSSQSLTKFWWHILRGCQVYAQGISLPPVQFMYRGLCGLVVDIAQWQSTGCASQLLCMGLIPGNCWLFTFLHKHPTSVVGIHC